MAFVYICSSHGKSQRRLSKEGRVRVWARSGNRSQFCVLVLVLFLLDLMKALFDFHALFHMALKKLGKRNNPKNANSGLFGLCCH